MHVLSGLVQLVNAATRLPQVALGLTPPSGVGSGLPVPLATSWVGKAPHAPSPDCCWAAGASSGFLG
jgi:hypothetical protein